MWGVVPAAGAGSRIQPLAFSKELLPVGSRSDGGVERPRAVSEYVVDRMIRAGARKICMIISQEKSDIMAYYGAGASVPVCYVVQPRPAGLCDALFRALPLVADDEPVLVGLPDTVWFPDDGLCRLGRADLEFLLFPVQHPERFDAVHTDPSGRVLHIDVKRPGETSRWIWGAFKLKGRVLRDLAALHEVRQREDEYIGTLVNAWIERGGDARAVRAGETYVDVGTVGGYREALRLLEVRR